MHVRKWRSVRDDDEHAVVVVSEYLSFPNNQFCFCCFFVVVGLKFFVWVLLMVVSEVLRETSERLRRRAHRHSHDRHFLNSICTHIADIDYETIITYTGTYDDMVVAKTQIRSQIEGQNAQREKKISQLNEFIAASPPEPGQARCNPAAKEVERLQVTELARSNIQRPFLKFEQKRPSGKHILEVEGVTKSYDENPVIHEFTTSIHRGDKTRPSWDATASARRRCSMPCSRIRRRLPKASCARPAATPDLS